MGACSNEGRTVNLLTIILLYSIGYIVCYYIMARIWYLEFPEDKYAGFIWAGFGSIVWFGMAFFWVPAYVLGQLRDKRK